MLLLAEHGMPQVPPPSMTQLPTYTDCRFFPEMKYKDKTGTGGFCISNLCTVENSLHFKRGELMYPFCPGNVEQHPFDEQPEPEYVFRAQRIR
jgi:hypothetical protein